MEQLLIKLEEFEGPLDLLEHLIKKNKLDICTISLIEITDQYLEYIKAMEDTDLEVSSEFIVMASNLVYIKSKALLPKEDDEEDPEKLASDLTRALKERRRMKLATEKFRGMQFDGTYYFFKEPEKIDTGIQQKRIKNDSADRLYEAFLLVLEKTQRRTPPPKQHFEGIVKHEPASVKDKATGLIKRLKRAKKLKFENVFTGAKHKNEVVAIFLAVLELMKLNKITVYEENSQILLKLDNEAGDISDEILTEFGDENV